MKTIKYLIVLLCAIFCINSYGMNKQYNRNELVDVDVKQIAYYTGSITNLRFYGEYKPRKLNADTFSFPLNACDPVPLHTFGDIRFFFLSAIAGNNPVKGSPILVKDATITNIIALRAKDDFNKIRVELYFGINKNDFKQKGRSKIYTAHLLVMQEKSTESTRYRKNEEFNLHYFNAKNLSTQDIGLEIKKYLETHPKDYNWKNPAFQQKAFHELLGPGWTPYKGLIRGERRPDVLTKDGIVIGNGVIYSDKVYWTRDENKLKGITYKHQ